MSDVVHHLPEQNRYVFATDGVEVGLTDYRLVDHDIHITHTEIEPSMRRTGLASEMVQAVLDHIRAETDYRVVADCPYVVTWLRRHPEYQALEQRT
ncbi:GNAT family N-acetyltransferase [Frigoribacterium sp. CG_9.8]|uniref:GNAT family N-acetyltransferase n=1 Tax=Frigoribacterium sp. CG_9.8 TaxID=2787733 RepID=UPI0018C955C8|nr:GNAT family N-acetyltransferase [Frigoribacterium sp. CG_9.8]MBG6108776.1 putative GNAT family acetyltransferase [Frigoribacterium sp. CG_9.8]